MRILATLVIGFTFFYFIGSEMMPLSDTGQAAAVLEMAPGTSFSATQLAVNKVEAIILQHPEVEATSVEVGEEPREEGWNPNITGYQMPQRNQASMMLTFSDKDSRSQTIWQVIDSIQKEAMTSVPGIRKFQLKEMGSDVMASPDSPVTIDLYGPNLTVLDDMAHGMMQVARKLPNELFQPSRSWVFGEPEYAVKVNSVLASQFGLSPADVANQLNISTRGVNTNSYFLHDNTRKDTLLVRGVRNQRQTLTDLLHTPITTSRGQSVPLDAIATVTQSRVPTQIQHDGMRRVVQVNAFYRKDHPPSMNAIMDWVTTGYGGNPGLGIKPVNFPRGYGVLVRGDMTQMMNSMKRLTNTLLISLALMYLVLSIEFKGFLNPLQMIASLPLELAGVFLALWVSHMAFSTVSLLGVIVLTGMDITTAVLMIDLIVKSKQRAILNKEYDGLSAEDAKRHRDKVVATACRHRLRPILMTSGLTLIVLLPVAIIPKTGLDAYQPLAVAVVGGLLVGTFLSLFDIPMLNTLLEDGLSWSSGKLGKKESKVPESLDAPIS